MPSRRELAEVSPEKLRKLAGFTRVERHSALFPKQSTSAGQSRTLQRRTLTSMAAVQPGSQPAMKSIRAPRPAARDFGRLRAVHNSESAGAEMVAQKLTPDDALGTLYSALVTYEYVQMKAERKRRLATAKDRRRVDTRWQGIVQAASQAFADGGIRGVTEADLDRFATELTRSRANFNAIVEIANSAREVVPVAGAGATTAAGNFVTIYDRFADLGPIVIPTPENLCDRPIEGRYTKHFSRSFSLSVRITYWCPTWTNPFRTCTKTVTLAGVSFSIGLEVGYRITCCGAIAWGQAYAQACATIVGATVCASCSARVVGVAGIARSGSGSSCSYGLGVTAELKCMVGSITVFYASVPFGWTITGPCPPPVLPCNTVG
jgi:hypothetical protein